MRHRGANPGVSAHGRRNAEMPGEMREQRTFKVVSGRLWVVSDPGIKLRGPDNIGVVGISDLDESNLSANHRHVKWDRTIRSRSWCGDGMADHVRARRVEQQGDRRTRLPGLARGDA